MPVDLAEIERVEGCRYKVTGAFASHWLGAAASQGRLAVRCAEREPSLARSGALPTTREGAR